MHTIFQKKSIKDISIKGKKILVRVDFNVGVNKNGKVIEDTRIKQALPTITYLIKNQAKIILISHLGRPKGNRVESLSIKPIVTHLSNLLHKEIPVVNDFLTDTLPPLQNGDICMLENIRYYPEEKNNDNHFAKKLASLADIFVNDAFATCHRSHASVVGVTKYLPSVSGLLLEKEIEILGNQLQNPQHPFVAIFGGAKGETKISLIQSLLNKTDHILIGGAIANTFLKALGYEIGQSLYESDLVEIAQNTLNIAESTNCKILLPTDVKIGHFGKSHNETVKISNIPTNMQALDIGPETTETYSKIINTAKTIVWNGPVGVAEQPEFIQSTDKLYKSMLSNQTATTIFGGGDTLNYLKNKQNTDKITHISTGGGAMLAFIEKGTLPGIEALDNI